MRRIFGDVRGGAEWGVTTTLSPQAKYDGSPGVARTRGSRLQCVEES